MLNIPLKRYTFVLSWWGTAGCLEIQLYGSTHEWSKAGARQVKKTRGWESSLQNPYVQSTKVNTIIFFASRVSRPIRIAQRVPYDTDRIVHDKENRTRVYVILTAEDPGGWRHVRFVWSEEHRRPYLEIKDSYKRSGKSFHSSMQTSQHCWENYSSQRNM